MKTKLFGVRFDCSNPLNPPAIATRLYYAEKFRFERSSIMNPGIDDFISDGTDPFFIRECSVSWNSETNSYDVRYVGQLDYLTSKGDICIDFPLFYFSRPSYMEFIISDKEFPGSLPSPMHFRDNHLYKHCFVSKYKANKGYLSRPGNEILADKTISEFRKGFWKANHSYCQDAAVLFSLNILRMIKYASLDSQNTIGYGLVNKQNTHAMPTNHHMAHNILSMDGGTSEFISDQNQAILSLGLEDPWGNLFEFVDGLVEKDSNIYYSNSLKKPDYNWEEYNKEKHFFTYKKSNIECATEVEYNDETGVILEMSYSKEYPELLYPIKSKIYTKQECVDGSCHNTIFHDCYWWNPSNRSWHLSLCGGDWLRGSMAGMFHMRFNNGFGIHTPYVGARSFIVKD